MLNILAVLQGVFVLSMILLILMQKPSSDGLANLAGSGGKASFIKFDLVKKATIFFAAAFFINSIVMANLSCKKQESILDKIEAQDD
jgi:protein translocase SecG subunit